MKDSNNALIACFEGHSKGIPDGCIEERFAIKGRTFSLSQLDYHISWDALMPVVEKIEGMGYMIDMQPHHCQIYSKQDNWPDKLIIDADFKTTRLENTYEAVTEFITWYNQQK